MSHLEMEATLENLIGQLDLLKDHYKALSKIPEIKYIELGYWKQTSKSSNPFYNLNLETVFKITSKKLNNVSIMIDYHYCSKNY